MFSNTLIQVHSFIHSFIHSGCFLYGMRNSQGNVKAETTESEVECQILCQKHEGCKSFDYCKSSTEDCWKTCHLKGKPLKGHAKPDGAIVSGSKFCNTGE